MAASPDKIVSILFVCTGNICRSPMAEFVFKDMVLRKGCSERFVIESAATTNWELGEPVHPGTVKRLLKESISCEGKYARQITKEDALRFDLIIGMDDENMRALRNMFGNGCSKLYKMMEFAGHNRDVADPYFTGDFNKTYNDIYDGCLGLLSWLGVE